MSALRWLLVLVTLLSLTACGGGGDDGEDGQKDNPPPMCRERPELCL